MKRIVLVIITFVFVLTGCASVETNEETASTPEFFNDIGKTLSDLKKEYPEGEFIVSLDGFPDIAAACFGEQGAEYVYFFFGGHSGDFEKAMNECEDEHIRPLSEFNANSRP